MWQDVARVTSRRLAELEKAVEVDLQARRHLAVRFRSIDRLEELFSR
jgi:hypothetical protein